MIKYGLPYQGGKSKLADWIINLFPKATHFFDLCAGGCSVAHEKDKEYEKEKE